jgi:hypothetical protein
MDYLHMHPFLSMDDALGTLRIAESLASFGTYADEATSDGLGEELPQRFDVGLNYVAAGIEAYLTHPHHDLCGLVWECRRRRLHVLSRRPVCGAGCSAARDPNRQNLR